MSLADTRTLRILVVGDSGVGKTSLVKLLATGKAQPASQWTVGCSQELMVRHNTQLWPLWHSIISMTRSCGDLATRRHITAAAAGAQSISSSFGTSAVRRSTAPAALCFTPASMVRACTNLCGAAQPRNVWLLTRAGRLQVSCSCMIGRTASRMQTCESGSASLWKPTRRVVAWSQTLEAQAMAPLEWTGGARAYVRC